MNRIARRVAACLISGFAIALSGTVIGLGTASAAVADTATVGDAAEAWYASAPVATCSSPLGCPPVAPATASMFPANTLHVGAAAAQETERSYLQPDLSSLPPGATLLSATLTVPIDTASGAGNQNLTSASIVACLVTHPFTDGVAGSTKAPPAVDCAYRVSAVYHAKANTFTVDLAPFLSAWNAGTPALGVALLPAGSQSGAGTWQVSFDGRNLAKAPHAQTLLTFAPPAATPTTPAQSVPSAPSAQPPAVSAAPAPQTLPQPGPAPTLPSGISALAQTPGRSPLIASQAPTRSAAINVASGFQYPEVLLAPLALIAGLVFLIRLFTSDAAPRRVAS
ncbi:MAG TPA: DNRLRE domain-containing protein [Mycobacteriales bacterium]|nr:DNRLRE domain-containing protein [Mycobacteriales bacterium]